jgi:hypothetical protein
MAKTFAGSAIHFGMDVRLSARARVHAGGQVILACNRHMGNLLADYVHGTESSGSMVEHGFYIVALSVQCGAVQP